MKVLWVSPTGAGVEASRSLTAAGHTLVGYGPVGDLMPTIEKAALYPFAAQADLLVVDGPFPLVKTPSSWRPSQESLFIEELRRHHGVQAIGPTPTIDLLVGDERYRRKWCRRLSLPYDNTAPPGELVAGFEDDAAFAAWHDLFAKVQFHGYFQLGYNDGAIVSCGATLAPDVDLCSRLS